MKAPLAKEVYEPNTIDEAVNILKDKKEGFAVIAGGTDLIIKLREGVIQPLYLLDIMKLPLGYIKGSRSRGFQIGATTTAREIGSSRLLKKELPLLVDAAVHLGGPQTMELATMGGNLCNASPCANFTNVLVALEARVKIRSATGEREVVVKDFCRGPGITEIKSTEIVTEVLIPAIQDDYGTSYIKHSLRKEMDIAVVGAAVLVVPEGDEVKKIRIALGSVGATTVLAENAQNIVEGKKFSDHFVESAAQAAAQKDASYIDDVRASAAYRKRITSVIVRRAINQAWAMAKGGRI
jgi:carbon-monoxide dehydrogenase medium subunit